MRIETSRLVLREFAPDDFGRMRAWQSDPRYRQHYPPDLVTGGFTQELLERFIRWQQDQPRTRFQLAIDHRDSRRLIGSCGIRRDSTGTTSADIGYELDPTHWGQGYATEAVAAVIAFGFDRVAVDEVTARVVHPRVCIDERKVLPEHQFPRRRRIDRADFVPRHRC